MKWRPVIAVFFLLLFGGFATEATARTQTKTESHHKKPTLAGSSFDETHPADLTPVIHFTGGVFKVRDYRLLPGFPGKDCSTSSLFVPHEKESKRTAIPVFLRFTRLLLFPKHHFW